MNKLEEIESISIVFNNTIKILGQDNPFLHIIMTKYEEFIVFLKLGLDFNHNFEEKPFKKEENAETAKKSKEKVNKGDLQTKIPEEEVINDETSQDVY